MKQIKNKLIIFINLIKKVLRINIFYYNLLLCIVKKRNLINSKKSL